MQTGVSSLDPRSPELLYYSSTSCHKRERTKTRLIENDNQICRVVMEKQPIPKKFGDDAGGRLLIRPYTARRWPLQSIKGSRLLKRRRTGQSG